MNLLELPRSSHCRALWTAPLDGEESAPPARITHSRLVRLRGPAGIRRVGLRAGLGYMKCGSHREDEWITDFRVLVFTDGTWTVLRHERGAPRPAKDDVVWYDLGNVQAAEVLLEARRVGIDGWWPGWNAVSSCFVLEGDGATPTIPARQTLAANPVNLARLPAGVRAERLGAEVRYRTAWLEVGFNLTRPEMTYLAVDGTGGGRTTANLLRIPSILTIAADPSVGHGLLLRPLGDSGVAVAAGSGLGDFGGGVTVQDNTVTYDVAVAPGGQRYRLQWRVEPDRLVLEAERQSATAVRAWQSAAWKVLFDAGVSPVATLGPILRRGEAGLGTLPALLHAPGFGSLLVSSSGTDALWRSDSARRQGVTSLELKLGEEPQPEGDYLLPAGRFATTVELAVHDAGASTTRAAGPASGASDVAKEALRRCWATGLTFRADTATLSNNANSIHAPMCMDTWALVCTRMGAVVPGLSALDLLASSLERWLEEGPGYASGRTSTGAHRLEDEYVMTGTACLHGAAWYIDVSRDSAWAKRHELHLRREIDRMRARDADGDGLIECPHRTGVSGRHEWSSNWYDVISFGWKDAFANALLYAALRRLERCAPLFGDAGWVNELGAWADRLQESFVRTFLNPETGWFAGWRSEDGALHDHAFLFVNGAAVWYGLVNEEEGRAIIGRLWSEMSRVGFTNFSLGLPGNLWLIPDEDLAQPLHGMPLGTFENGGATFAQAHYFIGALDRVGMTTEADEILLAMCGSFANGRAFGGSRSGLEWRTWDGAPSGYEGLLCDQFGVLALVVDRFGD